jgi:hypothetical protein
MTHSLLHLIILFRGRCNYGSVVKKILGGKERNRKKETERKTQDCRLFITFDSLWYLTPLPKVNKCNGSKLLRPNKEEEYEEEIFFSPFLRWLFFGAFQLFSFYCHLFPSERITSFLTWKVRSRVQPSILIHPRLLRCVL